MQSWERLAARRVAAELGRGPASLGEAAPVALAAEAAPLAMAEAEAEEAAVEAAKAAAEAVVEAVEATAGGEVGAGWEGGLSDAAHDGDRPLHPGEL